MAMVMVSGEMGVSVVRGEMVRSGQMVENEGVVLGALKEWGQIIE